MPPEPIPYDRKSDLFKERKHERSESLGSVARWRDSSSHHGSRDFNRWGSSDFRRPAGHGKQGGWHLFPEESGRGYTYSRSCDKMAEEDNCRPVVSRGDGKYSRGNRENRGSYGQRDWRGHSWETSNGSPNLSRRQLDANNDQRSVDDLVTYSSRPHTDFVNTWERHHLKDQHDKMGGVNGLGTGQRCDRESSLGSIDWKPLKWARSGSMSSRGPGYNHSSSPRSFGVADSYEGKTELRHKNAAAVESHSGEATAFVTSAPPSEDTESRKKPRLKWGEGLAKFEKKKVDGPDASSNKDGPVLSTCNIEPCNVICPGVVDKSPKVAGNLDCASPATPSSVACSSSSGVDDKLFGKAANVDNDVSNLSGSPGHGSQNHLQKLSFNLEKLDTESLTSLGSSLNELLQCDDPSSVDFSQLRTSAMNKLLIWKADISKVLEVTETEIDSLENELKSLKSVSGGGFPCPAAAGSLLISVNAKSCDGHVGGPGKVTHLKPVQIVSSDDPNLEKMPHSTNLHSIHDNGKEEDIDSPGTATSKFVEPLSLVNAVSLRDVGRSDTCVGDSNGIQSIAMQCLIPCTRRQVASVSADGDGNTSMGGGKDANAGACLSSITEDMLCSTILSSNKECANRAYDVFTKLLPKECGKIGNIEAISGPCSHNDSFIVKKFAAKKQFARFKERVLTLKFKALRHVWKEDMCMPSIKKSRPKSHKKPELGVRTASSGHQKNRSSIRSRLPLPGNHQSLVPKSEIIDFASKLLVESQVKVHRTSLKMPALILDQKEKMISKFISRNGLVEDPVAVEKGRALINTWTSEEKEIFLEKFANFGKDFRKIASFLDHKTTADCVEFYYKNHKSDYFKKIKKQDDRKLGKSFSAKTNLMSSDKRLNCEVNVASLDILSAASEMADSIAGNQKMRSGSLLLRGLGRMKTSRGEDKIAERASNFGILRDERAAAAADVLAGICGSLSSEAISSCTTSSVDPVEGNRNRKCLNVSPLCQQPEMREVSQDIDDGTFSDDSFEEMEPTNWTDEEKVVFLQAVSSCGKDFAMIARCVGTKSQNQCKVFFSKARKCLGLDLVHRRPENSGSPLNENTNGGGSDSDDACVVETSSVSGSDKLGTKTDEDLKSSVMNMCCDVPCPVEARNMSTDLNESKEVNGAEVHREVVNMVSDTFATKDKPNLTSDGNEIGLYSSDAASGSVMAQKAIIMSDSTEVREDRKNEVDCTEIIEPCHSNFVAEVSSGGHENDLEGRRVSSPHCPNDREDKLEGDTDALICSRLSFDVESRPQLSLEKPHISEPSVESPHADTNSLLQNAATAARCEKTASQDRLSSSTCDFQGCGDMCCHNSISNGDHQLRNTEGLSDHVEAASVLQSYPLQVPVKKEVNVNTSCSGSPTELPLLSQKIEQADYQYKTHLRSLSDSEKASRNGDVKLFGKILTNPSSTQKPNLTTKGSEENGGHHPMLNSNSSNLKCNGYHNSDGDSAILKFDNNDQRGGLENVPITSYGYWDGNTIQTGFSSLPDSAILLAKYPAAFSNYPASSAKSEQQSLTALAKNGEHHMNGTITTRENNGNNGVIDYEMYQNKEGTVVQPFMVDVKHRQDMFSELPRRNGFEAMSSLQQQHQGRGMVGMNGVGRQGIVVGSGVSDPVAAIKVHYSNSGGQTGSITRDDESWGGKGKGGSSRCSV